MQSGHLHCTCQEARSVDMAIGTRDIGIDHFKRYFDQTRQAFPDVSAQIDQLIAVDQIGVARLTWTATHTGEIFGIAPTGRRWSYAGVGIFRLEGGRIHDAWVVGDTQEFWRAICQVPPPRDAPG